jgi:hypothetical protein
MLGKPSGADLQLGLVTCPALYAWEEHPEMGELIQRKFQDPGDVELVRTTHTRNIFGGRTNSSPSGTGLRYSFIFVATLADPCSEVCGQGEGGTNATAGERIEDCVGNVNRDCYWAQELMLCRK